MTPFHHSNKAEMAALVEMINRNGHGNIGITHSMLYKYFPSSSSIHMLLELVSTTDVTDLLLILDEVHPPTPRHPQQPTGSLRAKPPTHVCVCMQPHREHTYTPRA
mmetsp:Transcript_41516/g.88576  ORF Transcript_41516/g.88576 Transcript_41516/m.88576 type:complete len:106 (-) Transcript_41516:104-421(-)